MFKGYKTAHRRDEALAADVEGHDALLQVRQQRQQLRAAVLLILHRLAGTPHHRVSLRDP